MVVMIDAEGKLYGYIRVSTDKQSVSPEVQRMVIQEAANQMGSPVSAWFQDAPTVNADGTVNDAASGKVFIGNRKAGRELLGRLKKGDTVIIAKIDRAFRSLTDCCQCLDRWERMGINLHICDMAGNLDISSPFGKAMVQILGVFAELERKMISQRTKEGLALRKNKGVGHSRFPGYGFKWEKRWEPKLLKHVKYKVRDEDERRVMREIVKWRMDDHSWENIRQHIVFTLKLVTKDGKAWNKARIMRAFQAELTLQATENGSTEK